MFDTLARLSDAELDAGLASRFTLLRTHTAEFLAWLAEFGARKLHRPAGYASLRAYCVGRFGLSDDVARNHVRVAHTARAYPAIFAMLHDGRLNTSLVLLVRPHLTPENVGELLAAMARLRREDAERVLAERFPRPDVTACVEGAPGPPLNEGGMPASADAAAGTEHEGVPGPPPALTEAQPAPVRVGVEPRSAGRAALHCMLDAEAQALLQQVRELDSVAGEDLSELIKRALKERARALEKQRFAAGVLARPRRGTPNGRYVPAEVRRAIYRRDGGQCRYVSPEGHRCEERSRLHIDHVTPYADGGASSVENGRLLCPAHNQLVAEQRFGPGFMERKREEARSSAHGRRAAKRARRHAEAERTRRSSAERAERKTALDERAEAHAAIQRDVTSALVNLKMPAAEARRLAQCSLLIESPTLERCLKHALRESGRARHERSTIRPVAQAPAERVAEPAAERVAEPAAELAATGAAQLAG